MEFDIWTDGGCSGNPGPGGWAFIVTDLHGKTIGESKGGERETTNNRMELLAVIKALKYIAAKNFSINHITVHTDSQYVEKGMTEWILRWKINGWKNSDRKPVKNMDLWIKLDKLAFELPVTWEWVKSHVGIPLNERCDEMTREAIEKLSFKPAKPAGKKSAYYG
ncbi:MAG: ribonuclease HI [Spirochaetaceae bacterium]|jgi:ribonuclease HI|nr:ribonuclease HI [Spirochaetaceae bacterium]